MSILPDAIRIIPRQKYCPIKKGEHNTCCTILTLSQNGTISISCLSNNHPHNKHTEEIKPNNTEHKALAKVLKLVWGPLAWRLAFNKRYLMVFNGEKNIVDITDDEEGCQSVEFRSENEMRKMFRGKRAYCGLQGADDDVEEDEEDDDDDVELGSDDENVPDDTTDASPEHGKSKKPPAPLWKVNLFPFDLWLNWNKRPVFKEVIFRPGNALEDGFFNMWSGFGVNPIVPPEGVEPARYIREHILNVICSGNLVFNNFLLDCFSHLIQFPSIKLGVVLVFQGGKGSGKSTVTEILKKLFGKHYLEVVNTRHFTGNFNMHQRYKVVIVLNEAVWGGDKTAESVMKASTTESTTIWESKGVNCKEGVNYFNLIVTSNNPFCVPLTQDNRRFFVLKVSDEKIGDFSYFNTLYNAMENEQEIEEFFHFLKNRRLPRGWRAAAHLPITRASIDMFILNHTEAEMNWIISKAKEGEWVINYPIKSTIISFDEEQTVEKEFVLRAFLDDKRSDPILNSHCSVSSTSALTKLLNRLLGDLFEAVDSGSKSSSFPRHSYKFGSMKQIRLHLEKILKCPGYFDTT